MQQPQHHDFSIISIEGTDAAKLLQGQLTVDVNALLEHEWRLAAACNPQGRVICIFNISKSQHGFLLSLPQEMAAILIKTLNKYALFYKVSIQTGQTTHCNKQATIASGIPFIYPETSGKYLPHELNLYSLGAISLDKGCYTGQEIIARVFYRGNPKSMLYQALIDNQALHRGQDVFAGESKDPVGSIVDYCVSEYNVSNVLITTDSENAKDNWLHLGGNVENFFRIKNSTRST